MQYIEVPVHYFYRKWECRVPGPTKVCTADDDEGHHSGCGYVYYVSMAEVVFKRMKSHSDESPLKYWNKD